MKVLAAIDEFSGRQILAQIKDRIWDEGTEFKIIHVIEPPLPFTVPPSYWGERTTMVGLRTRMSHKFAEAVQQSVKNASVSVEIPEGMPHQEILHAAEKLDCDLIIMGSHGRSGLQRFLLGSVSLTVSMHAPCSVMIAKEHQGQSTEWQDSEVTQGVAQI